MLSFKIKEDRELHSLEEAVESVKEVLTQEDIVEIKSLSKSSLIKLHSSLGRNIRNYLGLWSTNKALVIKELGKDGHPDDLSMKIIEKIWEN